VPWVKHSHQQMPLCKNSLGEASKEASVPVHKAAVKYSVESTHNPLIQVLEGDD